MATAAERRAAALAEVEAEKDPSHILLEKIAVAAAEMLPPKKEMSNPAFKGTKYAGLAQIAAVVEPALAENGLAHMTTFQGRQIVYTVFDLEHGTQINSNIEMPIEDLSGNIAQQIGSMTTYFRRYLMVAFWNLIPEDDDGNDAPRRATPARAAATPTSETIAEVQGGGSL